MTITTITGAFDVRYYERQPGSTPRSPGTHLSGILAPVCRRMGILPEEDDYTLDQVIGNTFFADAGLDSRLVRIAVGLAWERWIQEQFKGMLYQPGEFELDGIFGTPDGLELSTPYKGHEFKATWKSMGKHKIEKQWMWIYQMLGYAAMIEARFKEPITTYFLHVLWLMGDYTRGPGSGPKFMTYVFHFEKHEPALFWKQVVLANRHLAEPEGVEI